MLQSRITALSNGLKRIFSPENDTMSRMSETIGGCGMVTRIASCCGSKCPLKERKIEKFGDKGFADT